MQWFPFLRRQRLSPKWQYAVDGVIWRIVPTGSGKLVGEERDLANKTTSFFCLDGLTGEVMWDKATFAEQWWIGVEAVHQETLFLHGFASPDLPEHRSIVAVDLRQGTSLWSDKELTFMGAHGESVFAARKSLGGRDILQLDYRTGAVLKSLGSNELAISQLETSREVAGQDQPRYPLLVDYRAGRPSDAVALCQCATRGKDIIGLVEFLDYDDHIAIISYGERVKGNNTKQDRVKVILTAVSKRDGGTIFKDTIHSGAVAAMPDSFFVQKDMLYYVKDRCTLTAVDLGSASTHSSLIG